MLCQVQETLECSEQLMWWCLIFETQQVEHAVEFCLPWFPDFCIEECCNIPFIDTCFPLLLAVQALIFDFFLTLFQSGKRFLLSDIKNRDGRSGESWCSLACRQTQLVISLKRMCPILLYLRSGPKKLMLFWQHQVALEVPSLVLELTIAALGSESSQVYGNI